MKNVGILSMQRVNNFGSLLQCYSLKKIIEDLGNCADFIDIEPNKNDDSFMQKKLICEEAILANKSKLSKIDKYAFNRILIKIKSNRQIAIFNKFRKDYLNISDKKKLTEYDTCVIGSDEVFNCASISPWGFTTQLFGNVKEAKKVITYAASCGSTTLEVLPDCVLKLIEDSFKNVSSISVRDKNTYDFVRKVYNKKINTHFDPVLIGNFENEIKQNSSIKLPNKFCVVYSYYNRINKNFEIEVIKKFCKKNHLKIISIGAPQFWIKNHMVLNPFEMLYAFSKADYVITDTFHGTIFASKYSKKFAVLVRESNKNKLSDLIKRLKKQNHLCDSIEDIYKIYNIENSIINTNRICEFERKESIKYLKENI